MSYDWSNEKAQWANARPMDCEERLAAQAERTYKYGGPHQFVYRNLVKALPWYSSVRKILENPAYEGFFLKFKEGKKTYHVPPCTTQNGVTKCSKFYHDQEQTPQVPSKENPNPDGACDKYCDCGSVPCGEYLFDHRNGSMLTEWLLNEYVLSPTALGSPYIDGLFIDDFWCSNIINGTQNWNCNDPVQGPSEIDPHSQEDMGLSDEDIAAITRGWLFNMKRVQEAIVKAKGYTWSLMQYQQNANANPVVINNSTQCVASLTSACAPGIGNPYWQAPLLMGMTYNGTDWPTIREQVAAFLLMRGPDAYLGFGIWGMEWSGLQPFPQFVWGQRPGWPGPPLSKCQKVGTGNIFRISYRDVDVTLDCDRFSASYSPEPFST
eukprot:TRINITY_DN433_c0_g1_i3.p1 TRINITY_DN433_c0_g1~~TRINITY_DN433_c0_g1_i3.p1  ORF type:complete len:443 (-),score=85.63 TRINITY_DN433_c0_g1_i3:44-1180(-)